MCTLPALLSIPRPGLPPYRIGRPHPSQFGSGLARSRSSLTPSSTTATPIISRTTARPISNASSSISSNVYALSSPFHSTNSSILSLTTSSSLLLISSCFTLMPPYFSFSPDYTRFPFVQHPPSNFMVTNKLKCTGSFSFIIQVQEFFFGKAFRFQCGTMSASARAVRTRSTTSVGSRSSVGR